MKKLLLRVFIVVIFSGLTLSLSLAGNSNEDEIRILENAEAEAILKQDTSSLFNKYWSTNMVVNSPDSRIVSAGLSKTQFLAGKPDYSSFKRTIEKITFNQNIAISMGQEIIKPKGSNENAGKTLTTRFTNVWMKEKDSWKIVARQETVVDIK
jgi:hypothetical protein